MQAEARDRIVVRGRRVGEKDTDCEVLEVHGDDGAPPYRVRWVETGTESLFFPGPDASVLPPDRASG